EPLPQASCRPHTNARRRTSHQEWQSRDTKDAHAHGAYDGRVSSSTEPSADDGAIDELVKGFRRSALRRFFGEGATYVLARFVFLRFLGLVYFVAFASLARQMDPLIGHDGLLPVPWFLARVLAATGSRGAAFVRLPTIFWIGSSDAALHVACYAGV